jgi:trehalose 6-phosphate phosphatase
VRRHAFAYLTDVEICTADSEQLLIATDFDGTLCPIAPSPSWVAVSPAMLAVFNELARLKRVKLAVKSGRALSDLSERLPVDAIFAGNHGFEIRGPGMRFEHEEAQRLRPKLSESLRVIGETLAGIPGVWVEDKGLTATIHYRQAVGSGRAAIVLAVRNCLERYGPAFGLRTGERVLEIYPRCGWSKGAAVLWIRQQLGFETSRCLCIGDDETDESMFAVNTRQPNIRVGYGADTLAQYQVADCVELRTFFARLAHAIGTDRRNAITGNFSD